jgi:hypothetical protein
MTTETLYEQTNMKIQTFIYDLDWFLAVCYLGTLNSKTRRPTEIICSAIIQNESLDFEFYDNAVQWNLSNLNIL